MHTLSVDIEGLDLVLGGGVPVVQRHKSFAGESATLVGRGPPGSGKTVFGTNLATSLARTLVVDVAYACVELLPSELAAQHGGLRPGVHGRVVEPPFPREVPSGAAGRIYAGMLDLGAPRDEQAHLMPAIDELLAAVVQAGGKPGVIVVDSLSDGYHLGRSAPRRLADELCKMAAERGMILILLEETTDAEPSAWNFAADMVIELDIGSLPSPDEAGDVLDRRARFTKSRLGSFEPGPHRLDISPASGVRVYPNQAAYLRPWAVSTLLPQWKPAPWKWGLISRLDNQEAVGVLLGWSFNRCVTLVFGPYVREVAWVAAVTGQTSFPKIDVLLSFGIEPEVADNHVHRDEALRVVPLGTLFAYDQTIARALGSLSRIWRDEGSIGRVFLGDLARISKAWSSERVRQTLGTLIYFLRRAGIPIILVETGQQVSESPFVAVADVGVRVIGVAPPNMPQVTLRRLGLSARVVDPVQQSPLGTQLASYL
jgi:KaiC/GvpD/RAD55 family RecA-like ATPase